MTKQDHAAASAEAHAKANAAALEAVEAHTTDKAINIPPAVKAEAKKLLDELLPEVFALIDAGVDAGFAKVGLGSIATAFINPLINGLEPAVQAKLDALLA